MQDEARTREEIMAAVFVEIKSRYRDEALQAIKTAEIRGFDKGKIAAVRDLEDEVKKWKAIALAAGSQPLSETQSNGSLIKYIMEHLYQDIRDEWAVEVAGQSLTNSDVVEKMKSVLVRSSKSLTENMPPLFIASNQNHSSGTVAPTKKADSISTVVSAISTSRSSNSHSHAATFLRYYATVSIHPLNDLKNSATKIVGSSGTHKMYAIHINLQSEWDDSDVIRRTNFQQRKKYSDFNALYQQILRESSKVSIPPLPQDFSHEFDSESLNTVILQTRLSLWLNYILLYDKTQLTPSVLTFISDGVLSDFLTKFKTSQPYDSVRKPNIQEGWNKDDIHLSSNQSGAPVADYMMLQEIKRTRGDISRLEHDYSEAKLASKEYSTALSNLSKSISSFGVKLGVLAEFETPNSWETKTWTYLRTAFGKIEYFYDRVNILVNAHLFEPISFFGASLERIRGTQNNAKIMINPDAYSNKEKVDLVNVMSHEWNSFKVIKHELQVHHLTCFQEGMQREHRNAISIWEEAAAQLCSLDNSQFLPSFKGDFKKSFRDEFAAFEDMRGSTCRDRSKSDNSSPIPIAIVEEAKSDVSVLDGGAKNYRKVQPALRRNSGNNVTEYHSDDEGEDLTQHRHGHVHVHVHEQGHGLNDSIEGVLQSRRQKNAVPAAATGGGVYRRPKGKFQTASLHDSSIVSSLTSAIDPSTYSAEVVTEKSIPSIPSTLATEFKIDINQQEPVALNALRGRNKSDVDFSNTTATPQRNDRNKEDVFSPGGSIARHVAAAELPSVETEERLPSGWEQVFTEDGTVYYFHRKARISRWDKPTKDIAAALDHRLQEEEKLVDEKVRKRKMELDQHKEIANQKNVVTEQMQSIVREVVGSWAFHNNNPRRLPELLRTLPSIIQLVPDSTFGGIIPSDSTPPSDIKKMYMKVVRIIHPDKLPAGMDFEQRMLAEAVFVSLSDAYEIFKARLT